MYQKIRKSAAIQSKDNARAMRKLYLYKNIFADLHAIVNILLPSEKAVNINQHIKSIMYSMIELKTGVRPDKF